MQLGQLACDDDVLRSPEDGLDIRQGVQNAMWRFVKDVRNLWPRHLSPDDFFECCLPLAGFSWKKTVKGESFCWEPARDQAADGSIRAGDREDADSGSDCCGGD